MLIPATLYGVAIGVCSRARYAHGGGDRRGGRIGGRGGSGRRARRGGVRGLPRRRRRRVRTWFGGGTVHGPRTGHQVALDVRRRPEHRRRREKIMAILDAHRIKGTFFEVGKAIDAEPQIAHALVRRRPAARQPLVRPRPVALARSPRIPNSTHPGRVPAGDRHVSGALPAAARRTHAVPRARRPRPPHAHGVLDTSPATGHQRRTAHPRASSHGAQPGTILLLHDGLDGNPTPTGACSCGRCR